VPHLRVWDLDPAILCRKHLLGEHRELHAVWSIITGGKKGYSRHPETLRWVGNLAALYQRHEALIGEMEKRGYGHHSPLDRKFATGSSIQANFIDLPERQLEILKKKGCECKV
jgi:hypothetical protein